MTASIRKYLLIHLLCGIVFITALSAVGDYYLDRQAIGYHLDMWLSQSALSFQAFLEPELEPKNLPRIQKLLNKIPDKVSKYQTLNPNGMFAEARFQFQIFDNKNNLLLRSLHAPTKPLVNEAQGFSSQVIDGQPWRVFTIKDDQSGLTIVTTERVDMRRELGNHIAKDAVYILLLSYPILGLVIWFIVGSGLSALRRVAKEVAHRAPHYLDPVDIKAVPLEIKPLIDELNKLLLRLGQGFNREKSFSANAAHELRTPLAALKTQAQVALKTIDPRDRELALHKLIASVDRASHVVQQLLVLSRLVPEAALQDTTPVNLSKLATDVVANIAPFAIDKNIEIELVGGDQNIIVNGIATAIGILLRNLIDNAIRYTDGGGQVKIYVENKDHHACLRVVDDGPGIPPELRSQVFERFYRILGTKSPGSGLGLAIVQQIANLHHATVTLGAPESGQGLEVVVDFGEQ